MAPGPHPPVTSGPIRCRYQPPFNPDEIGVELPHGWILVSVGAATAIHLESGSSHLLELPTPEPIGAFNG